MVQRLHCGFVSSHFILRFLYGVGRVRLVSYSIFNSVQGNQGPAYLQVKQPVRTFGADAFFLLLTLSGAVSGIVKDCRFSSCCILIVLYQKCIKKYIKNEAKM